MVSHWCLSDDNSHQVSRSLLSMQADLYNAVVLMISTWRFIFKSSSPCTYHFRILPSSQIIIGINVILMFHRFFSSLARSWYLSFLSLSFNFTLWSAETAESTIWPFFFWWWWWGGYYYTVWSPKNFKIPHSPGQIPNCA